MQLILADVTVLPSSGWGGVGLLGATIRFNNYEEADKYVWQVLEVYPNSPAAVGGIMPKVDYLVGTSEGLFRSDNDLETIVSNNQNQIITFSVFSSLSEELRECAVVPNGEWGGKGSLGCDVGFGYLHRIPISATANKEEARGEKEDHDNLIIAVEKNLAAGEKEDSTPVSKLDKLTTADTSSSNVPAVLAPPPRPPPPAPEE
mgnify:FL=1